MICFTGRSCAQRACMILVQLAQRRSQLWMPVLISGSEFTERVVQESRFLQQGFSSRLQKHILFTCRVGRIESTWNDGELPSCLRRMNPIKLGTLYWH